MSNGKVIIMSAASGAGKTTIANELLKINQELVLAVSATTRKPRDGEVEGVDYFFMTEEEFQNNLRNDMFLEFAHVHNNWYGLPKSFVTSNLESGKSVILILDVQGRAVMESIYPDAISIFILAPSPEVLAERLRARATDSEEVIAIRLENSWKENASAFEKGNYKHFVVNDVLSDTIEVINKIITD